MAYRILASVIFVFVILLVGLGGSSLTPTTAAGAIPAPTPDTEKPVYSEYRGVTLGMSIDDARAKLGKARDSSDQLDYYVLSDGETVQVIYENKAVKCISTTYLGVKAPEASQIFGVPVEAKPDGSINKVVKYPKAGYWVSYIRTEGNDPMVMVTMHKLQKGEI